MSKNIDCVDGFMSDESSHDPVNNPSHYGGLGNPYQTINVIEAWELNYRLGNVVKYISRAGKKGQRIEDLKKAQWYLNREIELLEKEKP